MAISTNKCQLKVGGKEINQPVDMFVMPGSSGNTKYVSTEWLEHEVQGGGVTLANDGGVLQTKCMHTLTYPDGTTSASLYGPKRPLILTDYLLPSDLRNGVTFGGVVGTYKGTVSATTVNPEVESVSYEPLPSDVQSFLANGTFSGTVSRRPVVAGSKVITPNAGADGDMASYGDLNFRNTNGSFEISNLIPNKSYPIIIHNSRSPFVKAYSVKFGSETTRVRFIKTKEFDSSESYILFPNVRDIGGWTGENGAMIQYGKIFRGGLIDSNDSSTSPVYYTDLSAYDRKVFIDDLGIKWDLDLRHETGRVVEDVFELGNHRVKLTGNIQYTTSFTSTTKAVWKLALETVFNAVIHDEPIYIHCAAGADRTGSIMYVIEKLLGMSDADCIKDYLLTNFYTNRGTNTTEYSNWTSFRNAVGTNVRNFCISTLGINETLVDTFKFKMLGASISDPDIPEGGGETDEPTEYKFEVVSVNSRYKTNGSIESNTSNANGYFLTSEIDPKYIAEKCTLVGMASYFSSLSSTENAGESKIRITFTNGTMSTEYLAKATITGANYLVFIQHGSGMRCDNFKTWLTNKAGSFDSIKSVSFALPRNPGKIITESDISGVDITFSAT